MKIITSKRRALPCIVLLTASCVSVESFAPTTTRTSTTNLGYSNNARRQSFSTSSSSSSSISTTSSSQLAFSLEDIVYNAQSTASTLASSSLYSSANPTSLAILYFAGLLTSFSPCSLGLLPLTISYISNAAGEREDKAVFLPTVAFACGLAVVFCGLGLSVSFLGGVFGESNTGDSLLGAFALASLSSGISIAMGLQLLEIVNLPLPSLEFGGAAAVGGGGGVYGSKEQKCVDGKCPVGETTDVDFKTSDQADLFVVQQSSFSTSPSTASVSTISSSNDKNNDDDNGNASALFRTFLLGGSSALVASPCATPVLTSILGFVAASRDPALGTILLLIYTLGYSTPLLIVGASGGQALVNLRMAAESDSDDSVGSEKTMVGKIGSWVNPITASVLIFFGTNGFLEAVLGDASMSALAPIIE